jgi:hypothetical protein
MDSRRTADPDIPYPDQRLERAELMRNRTKRIASWPASFGSHQQAGHMTAIAKEASPKKSLPRGRPHMVGVAQTIACCGEIGGIGQRCEIAQR